MHLIFYDGECGLCDHVVQWVLQHDPKHIFDFAPLQGETAKKYLTSLPKETDSVVLVENYKTVNPTITCYGKAAFRICWLLGGRYAWIGWLHFLPAFLYNWGYRLIARYRKRIFSTSCMLPNPKYQDRFLN